MQCNRALIQPMSITLIVPSDKQMLEDLVAAAVNDARTKADQAAGREMQSIQQGMGLPPGLNIPGLT